MSQGEIAAVAPVVIAMLVACVAAWAWIVVRWVQGKAILPYERRRKVPWRGWHVLLIALLYLVAADVLTEFDLAFFPPHKAPTATDGSGNAAPAAAEETGEETDRDGETRTAEHPLQSLVEARPELSTWLLVIVTAIVVAPVFEEFLFRLVFQGWLEAVEGRLRKRVRGLRSLVRGLLPVLVVAALFALAHFHVAAPPTDPDVLMRAFGVDGLAKLVALTFGIILLRGQAGATDKDLGIVWEKVPRDIGMGLAAFAAVGFLVYLVQVAASWLVPKGFAPDPIALFPFALVLGLLYYRTHRIVPAVILHAALNATTVLMLWLAVNAGA